MGTQTVSTFDGSVTFGEDKVQVTIGLDRKKVSLVAGDVDIGEWSTSECIITDKGAGTFLIEAEDDTLSFVPEEPGRFAHSLEANGVPTAEAETKALEEAIEATAPAEPTDDDSGEELTIMEGPQPKMNTMIAFYVLAVITAALGIWAFVSLF